MASVVKQPGGFWVQFSAAGKRHTVRLGKVPRKAADDFARRVEVALEYGRAGLPAPAEVVVWLDALGDGPRRVLERAGLAAPRLPRTVGALVAERLEAAAVRSERTLANYRNFGSSLVEYFGADREASSITPRDALAYREWLFETGSRLSGPLSEATVSSRIRWARDVFTKAASRGIVHDNPFASVGGLSERNPDRDVYVPAGVIAAAIEASTDLETRGVLAIARWCGLRVPSEISELTWLRVDFGLGVIRVRAPKLNYRGDAAWREVPIFPEVEPHLAALWDKAAEGEPLVFPTLAKVTGAGISGRLDTALRKIGVALWPKPWVNLRASCERDLLAGHPIDKVAAWLGHSPEIALAHYNRATASVVSASGTVSAPGSDPILSMPRRRPGQPR